MRIEHLTVQTGDSTLRDSGDVLPATRNLFGELLDTARVRTTAVGGPGRLGFSYVREGRAASVAIYSMAGRDPIPITYSALCFSSEGREAALSVVERSTGGKSAEDSTDVPQGDLREPRLDQWIYTTILPTAALVDREARMMAGEIVLYIYEAIRSEIGNE